MTSLTFTKATAEERFSTDAYDLGRSLESALRHLEHDATRLQAKQSVGADETINVLVMLQRAYMKYGTSRAVHATVKQIEGER